MSRSILAMDSPESCEKCTVREECRRQTGKNNNMETTIPVWCPLIPEPSRMPLEKAEDDAQRTAWHGWNMCVSAFWGGIGEPDGE